MKNYIQLSQLLILIQLNNCASLYNGRIPLKMSSKDSNQDKYRPAPTDKDYFNRPGPWDERDLSSLLSANKAWAQRMVIILLKIQKTHHSHDLLSECITYYKIY
jgi:hypothetical protein